MSAEQVKQAIIALYSGDPNQQAQANQWLTSFQTTTNAWAIALTLLSPEQPPEIQFFSATLLVRKARTDWGKIDAATRQGLAQTFPIRLQEALTWNPPNPLVLRQLCVLLAAVVGASAGEACDHAINLATGMLSTAPALCFELLTALAEEQEDLDRIHRAGLVKQLLTRAIDVYNLLGQVLGESMHTFHTQQPNEGLITSALRCAASWLKLNPVAGLGCMLTPGDILTKYPGLYGSILAALCSPSSTEGIATAAGHALLLLFSSGTFGPDEARDVPAYDELIQGLLIMQSGLGQCSEGVALAVAQLGSACAERSPEICTGQIQQIVPFASFMLDCLSRQEPSVIECSMEYFLMINTVPLAERPPQLGPPLFEEMLRRLVPHASYPSNFTSWDDDNNIADIDGDDFSRLRADVLPEALEVSYGLLRCAYLTQAWGMLQEAKTWQSAESALYMVSAVSLAVKARVLGDPVVQAQQSSSIVEDSKRSGELLQALFTSICSTQRASGFLTSHPALATTACTLIERYAVWFGKFPAAPLSDALSFLLQALSVNGVGPAAAKAFHVLCLRCGNTLKDPNNVASLTGALHSGLCCCFNATNNSPNANGTAAQLQFNGLPQGPLALEDWQQVAGGLSRLCSQLPLDQRTDAVINLTAPFVHAAQVAASSPPQPRSVVIVTQSLRLLSSCLGQLSAPGDDSGMSAAASVAKGVAPVLDVFASSPGWQRQEEVASAVVEVYKQAVCSAKKNGKELLPSVLPALMSLFTAVALAPCLDVFGEALELHFQEPSIVQALLQALEASCTVAFPLLQGLGLRDRWPLTGALLGLADAFAVYAPATFWTSSCLPSLISLATAAGGLRENEPVARALGLLSHVTNTHERAADENGINGLHLEAIHTVLATQVEAIIDALLMALCNTCPRRHMRNAADCIRSLIVHPSLGAAAGRCFEATMKSGRLPGVREGSLTEEDCARVCRAALKGTLRGGRLIALLVDVGLVARGENTADVLLSYEM